MDNANPHRLDSRETGYKFMVNLLIGCMFWYLDDTIQGYPTARTTGPLETAFSHKDIYSLVDFLIFAFIAAVSLGATYTFVDGIVQEKTTVTAQIFNRCKLFMAPIMVIQLGFMASHVGLGKIFTGGTHSIVWSDKVATFITAIPYIDYIFHQVMIVLFAVMMMFITGIPSTQGILWLAFVIRCALIKTGMYILIGKLIKPIAIEHMGIALIAIVRGVPLVFIFMSMSFFFTSNRVAPPSDIEANNGNAGIVLLPVGGQDGQSGEEDGGSGTEHQLVTGDQGGEENGDGDGDGDGDDDE